MPVLNSGDTVAALRLGKGGQNTSTEKGETRPDARDIFNNQGGSLANPYNGQFPWVTPPQSATQINRRGSIAAPANGVQALVTSFQVPQAMEAVITKVVCKGVFGSPSPFVDGSGSIVWSIDVDRPLGATTQGYNPPDFGSIVEQLGDNALGLPYPIPGGIRLGERQTIRFKVTTAAPIPQGAPNYIICIFLGWYYPVKLAFPIRSLAGGR